MPAATLRHCQRVENQEQRRLRISLRRQDKALAVLRQESEWLFQEAVRPEPNLHVWFAGPADSAPIDQYFAPDGAYLDANKNWQVDPCPLTDKQRYMFSDAFRIAEERRLARDGVKTKK